MDRKKKMDKFANKDIDSMPDDAQFGFSIYCPLWVYKEFMSDMQMYQNTFWVKLMRLTDKARAYDALVDKEPLYEEPQEEQVEEEQTNTVRTLGS